MVLLTWIMELLSRSILNKLTYSTSFYAYYIPLASQSKLADDFLWPRNWQLLLVDLISECDVFEPDHRCLSIVQRSLRIGTGSIQDIHSHRTWSFQAGLWFATLKLTIPNWMINVHVLRVTDGHATGLKQPHLLRARATRCGLCSI